MSVSTKKSLKLIAIHKEPNQSFLQIKWTLDEEVECMWKIDEVTADSLQALTTSEANHTYLSFYQACDYSKTKYISRITRTSFNQSDSVYFACSKEYAEALHVLKQIQDVKHLGTLPFLSIKEKEQSEEDSIDMHSHLPIAKIMWMAVAFMVCVMTIGYMGFKNISFEPKKPVQAEQSNKQVILTSSKPPTEEKVEVKKPVEQPIKKPAIPVVKLKNTVNNSIPKGKVALTFDDGPSIYSKKIVNTLKKYKVGGTFFYIGTRVKKYPEYVEYTHKNGFSIGSHSMNHPLLTKLPIKKQETEIIKANQLIKKITGEPVVLFRPPYGARNNSTVSLMKKHKSQLVLWSIDTEDWKSRNSKKIIQSIKKQNASGTIILMHENQATISALPDIIEHLQKQDLEIVSLQ